MGGNDAQMAQMQAMMAQMQAGEGSAMMGAGTRGQGNELSAEAKKWVTVYPIYFDAKRKYMKGCRRVAYDNSCFWPKSEDIRAAVQQLTLMHAHEVRQYDGKLQRRRGMLMTDITLFVSNSLGKLTLKIGRILAESRWSSSTRKESQRTRKLKAVSGNSPVRDTLSY